MLCTGGVSVDQWRDQFLLWSTLQPNQVATFTSGKKEKLSGDAGVLVTTYSMLTHPNLSSESKKVKTVPSSTLDCCWRGLWALSFSLLLLFQLVYVSDGEHDSHASLKGYG